MASINQIVDYAERKYPPATLETDSNKVADLNDIHNEIYVKIAKLKNDFILFEETTVADQPTYSLPSDCRFDNIIRIEVAKDTDNDDFEEYDYARLDEEVDGRKVYGRVNNTTFILLDDETAIDTSGLYIHIYYYPRPTALSSSDMTAIPDLDPDYHNYLKYMLTSKMASQGDNPDTTVANFHRAEADEFMKDMVETLEERYNASPIVEDQLMSRW